MNKRLFTDYSALMDAEMPHSYYPRPQLQRESFICLNGSWDFCISKSSVCEEYTEKIKAR